MLKIIEKRGNKRKMPNGNVDKLYQVLDAFEKAGKDKKEIEKIRKLLEKGNVAKALEQIRKLNARKSEENDTEIKNNAKSKTNTGNSENNAVDSTKNNAITNMNNTSENQTKPKPPKKRKKKIEEVEAEEQENTKNAEKQESTDENDWEDEETRDAETYYDDEEEEIYDPLNNGYYEEENEENSYDDLDNPEEKQGNEEKEKDEINSNKDESDYEKNDSEEYDGDYDYEDDEDSELEDWNLGKEKIVYKEEVKKQESMYPEKLRDDELEKDYVGLLLNNPKLITKYYILFEECYFDDQSLLNIYKSILFTEGGKFTPEIAKKGFSFSVDNSETYQQKQNLREETQYKNLNPEEVYLKLRKLCVLRKSFMEEPREEIQEQIMGIRDYELYDHMSVEEVKAAIVQVSVTQKFKQAVLSEDLTSFLEKGENNLTNGLELPFHILSSVFKGIRKGETMAFAMPSNSGKSRFTINLAAYTAFIHKKKVLVISNEMSEEKMKLCLITTVINNPEIQKMHGQQISKTEGELLEFKFRPDKEAKVEVDKDGFVLQGEKETRQAFVERLKKVSKEFRQTIAVTDWANKQIQNSIYFINITDHTNDELKKVIMNYYYKEKIEYVFYDTLKTDTANIGNGEEIKRTATILSNLAQNFNMFICLTLQLTESTTLPINLTVNDLAVSRTVKEVLDTLCLIKQIVREDWNKYQYSLEEVDTKFFELKKYTDPDERYYACVVDKNRAGAKPKLLFNLNLAYNRWNELGYLRLKNEE